MVVTETPVAEAVATSRVAGAARRLRGLLSWRPGKEQLAALAVTLIGCAPVIAVVIQRAGRPYLPLQDAAVIDLRIRDVLTFSANTPLVGVYSRFGWNHPGPVMYYLVAPLAWMFGNPAWATMVGLALLQGLALIWTARLAWKTGGLRWTVVWVAITALAYVPMDPSALQSPWNPYVALPFFVLFLLQCWSVAQGDSRRVPGLVFVGGFLIQTHIGYALLVSVLAGWALVRLVAALWSERRGPTPFQVIWPTAVLVVMWLPVFLLNPGLDPTSNLSRLWRFYTESPHHLPPMGLTRALQYLATEFHWLPPWADGSQQVSRFGAVLPSGTGWLAIPVVLVALSWWLAWRRGRRELRLLAEMAALLLPVSAASLALIEGLPTPYLFYWRTVTGAATVVLTVTVVIDTVAAGRWMALRHAWLALLAGAVVSWAAVFTLQVSRSDGPVSPLEPVAASVLAQLHRTGLPRDPFLVRAWGTSEGGMAAALIDELDRGGYPVRVDRAIGYEFGYGRTATARDVRSVLLVIENSAIYSLATKDPGHPRVLAMTHPLPADQEAQLIRLQRRVWAVLASDGHGSGQYVLDLNDPFVQLKLGSLPGMSSADLEDLARLNRVVAAHGCLCSVLEVPGRDLSPSDPTAYLSSRVIARSGAAATRAPGRRELG